MDQNMEIKKSLKHQNAQYNLTGLAHKLTVWANVFWPLSDIGSDDTNMQTIIIMTVKFKDKSPKMHFVFLA
jgi:hypothetical protein